jgi:hypothetical protein
MDAVGTSTPKGVPGTKPDAAVAKPSPVASDFRTTMARLTGRQVSEGHAERFDAVVWANDAAKGAWDAGGAMPDGAMLVEEAIERPGRTDRADKPAGLLVMRKDGGSWSFVVVGPDGDVVDDARVAPCKACHALAPADSVFKPPARQGPDQTSSAKTSAAMTAAAPIAVATTAASIEARSAGCADLPSSR